MSESTDHACRQGSWCVARTRDMHDPNIVVPQWTDRPNTLCRDCEVVSFDRMDCLLNDWEQLDTSLTTARLADEGPRVGSSRHFPALIRLDVDALLNDIETETLRWARIITRGDPVPTNRHLCVKHCTEVIRRNRATLIELPLREVVVLESHPDGGEYVQRTHMDGVDGVLRLARLHTRAERVLDTPEVRVWIPEPCPNCARKACTATEDRTRITCQVCRHTYDGTTFWRVS
jgi:hypothetical protein